MIINNIIIFRFMVKELKTLLELFIIIAVCNI